MAPRPLLHGVRALAVLGAADTRGDGLGTTEAERMKMPWGKHSGRPLEDIPAGYLGWLVEDAAIRDPVLQQAVRAELRRRFGDGSTGRERGNGSRPHAGAQAPSRIPVPLRPVVREIVETGYRRCATTKHPDRGGDHTAMVLLNDAVAALRAFIGSD
jgi:hypothetical protein